MACGSNIIGLNLGDNYIHLLSDSISQSRLDDEFDFVKTYPESVQKTKLKEMVIDVSSDNYYISRISYFPDENKLLVVGFEIHESCAGVSKYLRRLDASQLFERLRWSQSSPIKIGGADRLEFGIELFLK